jgi:hypothetical protein
MSYWDSEQGKIIRWPTEKCEEYPDWDIIDCGCCAGIKWGGETPEECNRCKGSGIIYKHRKSGVIAEYPGGKFC